MHYPCFVIFPTDTRCSNRSCTDNTSKWLLLHQNLRTRGEWDAGVQNKNTQDTQIDLNNGKLGWTLSLPQTSRANPVQCCSTHQKKHAGAALLTTIFHRTYDHVTFKRASHVRPRECFTWSCDHVMFKRASHVRPRERLTSKPQCWSRLQVRCNQDIE